MVFGNVLCQLKKGNDILAKQRKYCKYTTAELSAIYKRRAKRIMFAGKLSLAATLVMLAAKTTTDAFYASYAASSSFGKFGFINDATDNYLKVEYKWLYPILDKVFTEFDLKQSDEKITKYIEEEVERADKKRFGALVNGKTGDDLKQYDIDEEDLKQKAKNEVLVFEGK